jgi:hypothetical protein
VAAYTDKQQGWRNGDASAETRSTERFAKVDAAIKAFSDVKTSLPIEKELDRKQFCKISCIGCSYSII